MNASGNRKAKNANANAKRQALVELFVEVERRMKLPTTNNRATHQPTD